MVLKMWGIEFPSLSVWAIGLHIMHVPTGIFICDIVDLPSNMKHANCFSCTGYFLENILL